MYVCMYVLLVFYSPNTRQEAGLSASKWTMTPRRERRGAAGVAAEPGPGDYDLEVPQGGTAPGAWENGGKMDENGGKYMENTGKCGETLEKNWKIYGKVSEACRKHVMEFLVISPTMSQTFERSPCGKTGGTNVAKF